MSRIIIDCSQLLLPASAFLLQEFFDCVKVTSRCDCIVVSTLWEQFEILERCCAQFVQAFHVGCPAEQVNNDLPIGFSLDSRHNLVFEAAQHERRYLYLRHCLLCWPNLVTQRRKPLSGWHNAIGVSFCI